VIFVFGIRYPVFGKQFSVIGEVQSTEIFVEKIKQGKKKVQSTGTLKCIR